MLTIILKNSTRVREQSQQSFRRNTHRQKTPMLRLQQLNTVNLKEIAQPFRKDSHLMHLPSIYKTQLLMPPKKYAQIIIYDSQFDKKNQKLSIPSVLRPPLQRVFKHDKENISKKIVTDQRERKSMVESSKVCHNFVNNKKNRKRNRMSRIIEKVISEDIEPWNLQHSKLHQRSKNNLTSHRGRKFKDQDQYHWEKYVLGNHNSMNGPF